MPFSRKDSAGLGSQKPKRHQRIKLIAGFFFLVAATISPISQSPAQADAPTVSRVSPSSGPLTGGQTVLITGRDFTGTTGVDFGATPATTYALMNDKQIVAVVPASSAGGKVLVEVTNGTGPNTTGAQYDYKAPKITKIEPAWAEEDNAAYVTITGEGLLGTAVGDITFGSTNNPTAIWVISDKQIVVETPVDDTAPDPDIVVNNGIEDVTITRNSVASTASEDTKFLFSPGLPTVTSFTDGTDPATGTDGVAVGQTLTIVGTQMWGVTEVKFGTSRVTNNITVNPAGTNVTVPVPQRSSGPVDVTITNAAGTSVTNLATTFSYYSNSAPTITRIYPEAVDATDSTGGGTILVTGRGLTGVTTSEITLTCSTGTPTATSATAVSDTSLIIVMPDNDDDAATCDLTLENPTDNTKTTTKTAAIRYI